MKHRRNKVKREHGIIENALPWLESLSRLAEVTDIIPGVIDVNRSSERGIVYKYETQTGCKLLLKSSGSIQEAFVVTKNPLRVQEWVSREFPPDSPSTATEVLAQNSSQNELSKKFSKVLINPRLKVENEASVKGPRSNKRSRYKGIQADFHPEEDVVLNVADRLDTSTRKALKHLKKSLEAAQRENQKAKGNRNTNR